MSIGEMQSCLARLYVDEPFRRLFAFDASTVLDEYALSDSEREALTGINRTLLDEFASSLIGKRRKPVERAYPLLFKLDGSTMLRCYRRFYHLYPAKPNRSFYDDIADFGVFAEETLAAIDSVPAFAPDIARYERHCAAVANAAVRRESAQVVYRIVSPHETIPIFHPQTRMADFNYDVATLERVIVENPASVVPQAERCELTILFFRDSGDASLRVSRINAASKSVLDLCDGDRTVADIVSEVERSYETRGLSEQIVAVIERLIGDGALVSSLPGVRQDKVGARSFFAAEESFAE